jgi:hypothetical protein
MRTSESKGEYHDLSACFHASTHITIKPGNTAHGLQDLANPTPASLTPYSPPSRRGLVRPYRVAVGATASLDGGYARRHRGGRSGRRNRIAVEQRNKLLLSAVSQRHCPSCRFFWRHQHAPVSPGHALTAASIRQKAASSPAPLFNGRLRLSKFNFRTSSPRRPIG